MEKQQDLVPLTDQFERKLSLFDSGSISDHKQPETLNSTTRLLLLEQLKQKIDRSAGPGVFKIGKADFKPKKVTKIRMDFPDCLFTNHNWYYNVC